MAILTIRSTGVNTLRIKLQMAHAAIGPAVATAIINSGEHVAQALATAAPRGSSDSGSSQPMGDDEPGRLAESFLNQALASGPDYAATQVITTQPNKLNLVRNGRGEVRPRTKKALMWNGLDHPVRRSRAVAPNDFVSPVLQEGADYARAQLEEVISTEVLSLLQ